MIELIDTLPARDQYIITQRLGLEGDPKTLKQVGKELNISAGRVRQLQNIALRKLKKAAKKEGYEL